MAMQATSGRGARSALNVTPLIDVLLVLLIIFMTIQPTAARGLQALAPRPSHDGAEPDPRTVVLVVRDGAGKPTYALNSVPTSEAELQPRLQQLVQQGGLQTLFLQADAALDYGAVLHAVNVARTAGLQDVGVLTPKTLAPQ